MSAAWIPIIILLFLLLISCSTSMKKEEEKDVIDSPPSFNSKKKEKKEESFFHSEFSQKDIFAPKKRKKHPLFYLIGKKASLKKNILISEILKRKKF